jgi:hypothetical protein
MKDILINGDLLQVMDDIFHIVLVRRLFQPDIIHTVYINVLTMQVLINIQEENWEIIWIKTLVFFNPSSTIEYEKRKVCKKKFLIYFSENFLIIIIILVHLLVLKNLFFFCFIHTHFESVIQNYTNIWVSEWVREREKKK